MTAAGRTGLNMNAIGVLGGAVLAVGLAGCSVSTASFNDASGVGGAVVGSLGTPDAAPAAVTPPMMGAFLEGPVGAKLGTADRDKAYQAELDALSSGDRKTWRGGKGSFGFVALAGAETPDGCRAFSHTVYIGGRPQSGKGTGCKAPDGAWRVTG